ncbi:MAG: hypothetical protein M1839_007390 [Geoglossum umbratile]|nr:MAG: hypothetical protein M1839_007390 [Geoglossum umbratile]
MATSAFDKEGVEDELRPESSRLFSGEGNVEVWDIGKSQGKCALGFGTPEKRICDSAREFNINSIKDAGMTGDCIFFIHQTTSWGRLQISFEMFKRLLTLKDVSPIFTEYVQAFGTKVTGEDDPFFGSYNRKVSFPLNGALRSENDHYEFCFLIRRFEKHGRPELKDPWSLRKMAVYQRYNFATRKSVWILIRPFEGCKSRLWRDYSTCFQDPERVEPHPMTLHILFIIFATLNWRQYLDTQRRTLSYFVSILARISSPLFLREKSTSLIELELPVQTERASFTSIEATGTDYEASFTDNQRLQTLRYKLLIAQVALDSNLNVARGIKVQYAHLQTLSPRPLLDWCPDMDVSLEVAIANLQSHKRTIIALLDQEHGVSNLFFKILDYKNDNTMKENSRIMARMVATANAQSESLKIIAEKTRKDSRLMRIVAFITLVYLPASLIATISSSGLIQIAAENGTARVGTLSVHKEIWIYIVAAVVLTAITLVMALLWDRRANIKEASS